MSLLDIAVKKSGELLINDFLEKSTLVVVGSKGVVSDKLICAVWNPKEVLKLIVLNLNGLRVRRSAL